MAYINLHTGLYHTSDSTLRVTGAVTWGVNDLCSENVTVIGFHCVIIQ